MEVLSRYSAAKSYVSSVGASSHANEKDLLHGFIGNEYFHAHSFSAHTRCMCAHSRPDGCVAFAVQHLQFSCGRVSGFRNEFSRNVGQS